MNITDFMPYLNIVLALGLAVGGYVALRRGYAKQAGEIEQHVIDALRTLNEAQERQIATCEKEIARLKRVVATIQYALKRRGLRIEIEGDSITLIDDQTKSTRTVQVSLTDKQIDEEEQLAK